MNLPGEGAESGGGGWGFVGWRQQGSGDPEDAVGEPAGLGSIHPPIAFLRSAGAVLEAIWGW